MVPHTHAHRHEPIVPQRRENPSPGSLQLWNEHSSSSRKGFAPTVAGDIAELRSRYRELILSWAAASAAPAEANRLFRKIQQMQKELRESEAGREVIGGLLD